MGFLDLFKSHRREKMEGVAAEIGLQFKEKGDKGLVNLLSDFKLFKIGHHKTIRNLLWNDSFQEDLKVRLFDYRYTVSTGNSAHVEKQTVFFIQSKQLGLPQFHLQPESFIHRIGHWLGFKDINLDNEPEFSRKYYLKGPEEELIRQTFSDPVARFLKNEKAFHAEGLNYFLIIYFKKKLVSPEEIPAFFNKCMHVFEVLKGILMDS